MPRGKKVAGRDWRPGQSGNPNGRPPLPEDLREGRKLSKIEFERALNSYLYLTDEELTVKLASPETTQIEGLIGMLLVKAKEYGDQKRLDFILDRLIGKVPATVDVNIRPEKRVELPDGTSHRFITHGEDE